MIDKSIREIVRRCRPHMWAAAALFFACYLADVVLITCVAYALTTIIYPQQPVLWVIAPILLVVAFRCALRMLSLSQCSKVSSMVELELSERITEKLTRLSWTRVAERREREFVWCARKGATCIGDLLGNVVPVAVGTLGLVIVILIGGLYLGWRMPATLLAFVVAVVAQLGDVALGQVIGLTHQLSRGVRFHDVVRQGDHVALHLAGHVRARQDEDVRAAQLIGLFQQIT